MNLLIPYIKLNHPDPLFSEYTYGDSGQRGRKLLRDVNKGDYLFFHTSRHGKKYITAYYIVDRILETTEAIKDKAIILKYRNPHILECLDGKRQEGEDDAVVFGDPITSYILEKPLLFDRSLAEKLTLNIKFTVNKSDTQIIGPATRAFRELNKQDVEVLLESIRINRGKIQQYTLMSSEEVSETIEKDIEHYLSNRPTLLGEGLRLCGEQQLIGEGRLDLLLENSMGDLLIVEVKYGRIGRDAVRQIKTYVHDLQREVKRKISGAIVCSGVMPAYIEELGKQKDIQIFVYGWNLRIEKWDK